MGEHALRLFVDPVEILADQYQGAIAGLPPEQLPDRVEDAELAFERVEPVHRIIGGVGAQQELEIRRGGGEVGQRVDARHGLRGVVPFGEAERSARDLDHREVGRRLPDRGATPLEPAGVVRELAPQLVEQARLAHAGWAGQQDRAPVSAAHLVEERAQLIELGAAAHERRQPARRRSVDARLHLSRGDGAEHAHRIRLALDGALAERLAVDVVAHLAPGRLAEVDASGIGHPFETGGEVRGVADRRVIHDQVVADRTDDDRAGVQPDAELLIEAVARAHVGGVLRERLLHFQRRQHRSPRRVLVRQRRPNSAITPSPRNCVIAPS